MAQFNPISFELAFQKYNLKTDRAKDLRKDAELVEIITNFEDLCWWNPAGDNGNGAWQYITTFDKRKN